MNRADLRFLLEAAFTAGRADYAHQVASAWLKAAPGDLAVRFQLARALAATGRRAEALSELDQLTQIDIEHTPAYRLMAALSPRSLDAARAACLVHGLTGQPAPAGAAALGWVEPARQAVMALEFGRFDVARDQVNLALRHDPALPLLSLILLKTHWLAGEVDLALPLAKGFHDRWPTAVQFMLCLAEGLNRNGSSHQAVEILHTAGTLDAGGDVVGRYWSDLHPYRDLWPQPPAFRLPIEIPHEVGSVLGVNRLKPGAPAQAKVPQRSEQPERASAPQRSQPKNGSAATARARLESDLQTAAPEAELQGQAASAQPERRPLPEAPMPKSTVSPVAEELHDIQAALTKIASQIGSGRAQRKPVHVILFSPRLLEAKFGPPGADQVLGLVMELAKATARHRRVPVSLLAPEAPAADFHLKPVNPSSAWEVKMMLHDFDRQLIPKGQTIGSLLIIGGDDLLPFHRLPNPTDDADDIIPSDNPYATSDDNYFILEYAVGRLPSPCGRDPEPLCRLLRHTIHAHQSGKAGPKFFGGLWAWLSGFWRRPSPPASVGYSASVWKQASIEVFAPIGGGDRLGFSPPLEAASAPNLNRARLSYFNLHGVEDGPNWFGQRDEGDGYGPLYPLALEPRDAGREPLPRVVYTEACYGANILNKAEPDAALCLRFLTDGVWAFVGSTKIAYGSVASPLIGADMLGRAFWENLLTGMNVGEALRRAKLQLAQAMHKRQHFLDGEDQKTLISFVLYGDPLLPVVSASPKGRFGKNGGPAAGFKTVAMEYEAGEEDEAQPETVAEIKALLSRYLPGSESAQVSVSRPLSPIGAKSKAAPTHRVYTLAKTIRYESHTIPSYARVTVNKAGKVVKLAVSR